MNGSRDHHGTNGLALASGLADEVRRLDALLLAIADGAAPTYVDAYGQHHYDVAVSHVVAGQIDRMQNMDWSR